MTIAIFSKTSKSLERATLVIPLTSGSANLVKHKESGEMLISKKIILAGLDEKEKQGSLQEANFLKRLKHSNIVSHHSSFMEKDVLYIQMEYCEQGDLSQLIKRK